MGIRGRGLRFTVVLAVTVLALTGFSRGHGHSSRHGGGSGGGCSSSSQDHDGSSSYGSSGGSGGSSDYVGSGDSYPTSDASSGDSYSSSGGSAADSDSTSGGGTGYGSTHRRPARTPSASSPGHGLKDATVELLSCPTGTRPWAEVEVTNPNGREADFRVVVHFLDGASLPVDDGVTEVAVAAGGTRTAVIPFDVSRVSGYEHCEAVPRAEPVD